MFSIEPYAAQRHAVIVKNCKTFEKWEPCRVIGIDATKDEPEYVVEITSTAGETYVDRADLIRRAPQD